MYDTMGIYLLFQTCYFQHLENRQINNFMAIFNSYHLVMTNIAMENHHFQKVNHLFLWAIYTMAMLVITRGYVTNY